MSQPDYQRLAKENLQRKDPNNPEIPLVDESASEGNIRALIRYWSEKILPEKNGVKRIGMPYRYVADDAVQNYGSQPQEFQTVDVDYFESILADMAQGVEVLDREEQIVAQAASITDIKTLPSNYIYTDETEEDGAPDRHNFLPRNYDRSQITSLNLGEMVKIRAHYADQEGVEWYFVTGHGGVFGWVRAEHLYLNGGCQTIDQVVASHYPENPHGLTVAHIDVPFLKIDQEVTRVDELRSRSGLTLGSRIYGYQDGNNFVTRVPVRQGGVVVLQEVRIPLKYVYQGYKEPGEETVRDFLKLLGNPYAWGGNAVWRRGETQPLYGLNDCSGIIRQVLKMYGIDLPANDSAQMRMGEVLVENIVKGKRQKLTKKQVNRFLHEKYKPGLTFFAYGGHIAVVISKPGQPLQLLHARFHRRIDRGKYSRFRAGGIEPLELDKVVVTGSRFVDRTLVDDTHPGFNFISKPIAIWHLPVE